MRQNGTVTFLLADHLGSTSVTTDSTGVLVSSMLYTAFGDARSSTGMTASDYLYTGQREISEIGLYFYNARFYDAYLNRFISADTIVPEPGDIKSYDRYAYVYNNPIRYSDPSGHEVCDENGNCFSQNNYKKINGQTTLDWWSMVFGINFTGEEWSNENQRVVINTVRLVGARYASYYENSTSWGAFRAVHGNKFTFTWSNQTPGNAGLCLDYNWIILYQVQNSPHYFFNHSKVVVHELGHAFNNATGSETKNSLPSFMLRDEDGKHTELPGQYYGFEGGWDEWQFGYDNTKSEVFADMFVGWTYNRWDLEHKDHLGVLRREHMDVVMTDWFNP